MSASFANSTTLFRAQITNTQNHLLRSHSYPVIKASFGGEDKWNRRRDVLTVILATSTALGLQATPLAQAQNWGTRSFLREKFFEPGLSPEDAVARIKQTAEGLHSIREMLETMSWRYVLFYIRLKISYLSQDLKNAMSTLPESRRSDYVKTANELVDNMSQLDKYVRTPKIYESYLYYEKSLKSIDQLVALLV